MTAGDGLTVTPDALRGRAADLSRAEQESSAGLDAARRSAESCAAGFPASLAGPFAEANAHFARVDTALATKVAEAADLLRGGAEGYAATDAATAAGLRGAAGLEGAAGRPGGR